MPFFLDTQETSQRFGNHIAEFCSLLDTNHIRHGSPDDLFEFAKILESSNQFRFDLSALVKTVAHREGDELLLTDMMGIIVAAVGGPTATNTTADLTKPSNILMEFLLGTGCWRKFGSPSFAASAAPTMAPSRPITHSPPVSPPVVAPTPPSVAPAPKPPVKAEEPARTESAPPVIPAAAPVTAPVTSPVTATPVAPTPAVAAPIAAASTPIAAVPVAPVPASTEGSDSRASLLDASSELRQTLTRLEINTLQVKLHLESIEQRINRIEPPPVPATTTAKAAAPEPVPVAPAPSVAASPPVAKSPPVAASPVPISPVPVPPAPIPLPPVPPPPVEPPPATRPGAADSGGRFSLFGIEADPAEEAELPPRGRAVFSRPVQRDEPRINRGLEKDSDLEDLSSPTFAFVSEKGRNMVPFGVGLALLVVLLLAFLFARSRGYFGSGGSANVSSTSAAPSDGQSAGPASGAPAAPMTGTSSPPASDGEGASASSGAAPEAGNSKFKYVPPSVMAGNLLSAPRPEYPASARAAHIQGTVALQATISRAGSIRTLHAIKGPPALRQAAVDAVRGWRYKPYTVDGRPVDVATTVYVEFTLGPPPAIAH